MVDSIINNIESESQPDYKIKISESSNPNHMCRMVQDMFSDQDIKVIREDLDSSEMKLLKK